MREVERIENPARARPRRLNSTVKLAHHIPVKQVPGFPESPAVTAFGNDLLKFPVYDVHSLDHLHDAQHFRFQFLLRRKHPRQECQ